MAKPGLSRQPPELAGCPSLALRGGMKRTGHGVARGHVVGHRRRQDRVETGDCESRGSPPSDGGIIFTWPLDGPRFYRSV